MTLARLEGVEPPTVGLEIRCSIHLSYRRPSGCDISRITASPRSPRARRIFRYDCARGSVGSLYSTKSRSLTRGSDCEDPPRKPVGGPAGEKWSGREDLNLRHPAPKAGALPGCATPRCISVANRAGNIVAGPRARQLRARPERSRISGALTAINARRDTCRAEADRRSSLGANPQRGRPGLASPAESPVLLGKADEARPRYPDPVAATAWLSLGETA